MRQKSCEKTGNYEHFKLGQSAVPCLITAGDKRGQENRPLVPSVVSNRPLVPLLCSTGYANIYNSKSLIVGNEYLGFV